jgi:hypothetical protein
VLYYADGAVPCLSHVERCLVRVALAAHGSSQAFNCSIFSTNALDIGRSRMRQLDELPVGRSLLPFSRGRVCRIPTHRDGRLSPFCLIRFACCRAPCSNAAKPMSQAPMANDAAARGAAASHQSCEEHLRSGGQCRKTMACRYGLRCKRPDCWHDHPQGRYIDSSPALAICRLGSACDRAGCFYSHPQGQTNGATEHGRKLSCLYLDELSMPSRPNTAPSLDDCEVFVDPFPCWASNKKLRIWLEEEYGLVENIFQLPGQLRGYVRFASHAAAARCVAEHAGVWSESERALASDAPGLRSHPGSVVYPQSLVTLLYGKVGENMKQLADRSGLVNLTLVAKARRHGTDPRVHFAWQEAEAQDLQIVELRLAAEDALAAAHTALSEAIESRGPRLVLVTGLPREWSDDDVKRMMQTFGEVEAMDRAAPNRVSVIYVHPMCALDATNVLQAGRLTNDSEELTVELCQLSSASQATGQRIAPTTGTKDTAATGPAEMLASGSQTFHTSIENTVFVGNLTYKLSEDDLIRHFSAMEGLMAVRVPRTSDGECRGYAFLGFADPADVGRAVSMFNGSQMLGRCLRVEPCNQPLQNEWDKHVGGTRATGSGARRRTRSRSRSRQHHGADMAGAQTTAGSCPPKPSMKPRMAAAIASRAGALRSLPKPSYTAEASSTYCTYSGALSAPQAAPVGGFRKVPHRQYEPRPSDKRDRFAISLPAPPSCAVALAFEDTQRPDLARSPDFATAVSHRARPTQRAHLRDTTL